MTKREWKQRWWEKRRAKRRTVRFWMEPTSIVDTVDLVNPERRVDLSNIGEFRMVLTGSQEKRLGPHLTPGSYMVYKPLDTNA